MNDLGSGVLKAMESSSLGRMSVYILSKQCLDLGIDLEKMTQRDIPVLAQRLRKVLPFFLGDETDAVVRELNKLANGGQAVMT